MKKWRARINGTREWAENVQDVVQEQGQERAGAENHYELEALIIPIVNGLRSEWRNQKKAQRRCPDWQMTESPPEIQASTPVEWWSGKNQHITFVWRKAVPSRSRRPPDLHNVSVEDQASQDEPEGEGCSPRHGARISTTSILMCRSRLAGFASSDSTRAELAPIVTTPSTVTVEPSSAGMPVTSGTPYSPFLPPSSTPWTPITPGTPHPRFLPGPHLTPSVSDSDPRFGPHPGDSLALDRQIAASEGSGSTQSLLDLSIASTVQRSGERGRVAIWNRRKSRRVAPDSTQDDTVQVPRKPKPAPTRMLSLPPLVVVEAASQTSPPPHGTGLTGMTGTSAASLRDSLSLNLKFPSFPPYHTGPSPLTPTPAGRRPLPASVPPAGPATSTESSSGARWAHPVVKPSQQKAIAGAAPDSAVLKVYWHQGTVPGAAVGAAP